MGDWSSNKVTVSHHRDHNSYSLMCRVWEFEDASDSIGSKTPKPNHF